MREVIRERRISSVVGPIGPARLYRIEPCRAQLLLALVVGGGPLKRALPRGASPGLALSCLYGCFSKPQDVG